MSEHDEPRKALWAKCLKCGHCWPAGYYPLQLALIARLAKRSVCPMCGAAGKKVAMAKQDNGKLLEPDTGPKAVV